LIGESELKYLNGLLKGNSEKWESADFLTSVHTKAVFTAKVLTLEMIEGKAPIGQLLNQYSKRSKQSVRTLLYRIEKLYSTKDAVTKIFNLIIKIFH
jgi:hypothetical protein